MSFDQGAMCQVVKIGIAGVFHRDQASRLFQNAESSPTPIPVGPTCSILVFCKNPHRVLRSTRGRDANIRDFINPKDSRLTARWQDIDVP